MSGGYPEREREREMERRWCRWCNYDGVKEGLKKVKAYVAMVLLQVGFAGMYVLTMVSFKRGMSSYVFSVYRHVVATLVIAPFAYFLERKKRPKMTFGVIFRIAMLAFLEPVLDTNLYNLGMKNTTSTFASATLNTLPAITFILALLFRLESVNLRKIHNAAKVIGTIITFIGAMVMAFYKGQVLTFISFHHHDSHNNPVTNLGYRTFVLKETDAGGDDEHRRWVIGTVLLFASCIAWAAFFILQSLTLKEYPAALSLTALICLMGVVEGAIATLVMERDMSVWKIGFDSSLLTVVYSGVVCSGIAYYVQGVVSRERGPFFVSAFSPLCMIATAFLGSLFLAETMHLGSIIGAVLIVFGLYTLVWGKSKEPLLIIPTTTPAKDPLVVAEETKINVNHDAAKSSGDDHSDRREPPAT